MPEFLFDILLIRLHGHVYEISKVVITENYLKNCGNGKAVCNAKTFEQHKQKATLIIVFFLIDGKSARYRDVMPAVLPLAIASSLGALVSVLVMIRGQAVLYVTFIVLPFYRSFLYTIMGGFITTL